MITDERTQNKLYADTETTLFRLENKPEAVSRIMEIIRDTPEYVQLMHSLPTYAEEDRQAAWWQGKESDSLLAELLHVLELYTPEGFILGPVSGRTHAFGYADPEYVKNLIYRIEIELDWGYEYGKKNEYRKKKKLYAEIAEIFTAGGYTAEMGKRGKGCRITKGNTRLYSHYGWITGQCDATHLVGVVTLLLGESRRFRFIKCALLDFVFSFTREEELEYYRQQHKTTIYYQIFDLFRRKPWTVTDNLMTVASEINIPTKEHPEGLDCDCPACQYVREAYRKLIENGYLEEYTQTRIREETLCARATEKGISKNIFYGTQL